MPLRCPVLIRVLILCHFVVAWSAHAQLHNLDQVLLTNGDRISGTVVSTRTDAVVLNTTAAGMITIQRSAIQQVVLAEAAGVSQPLSPGAALAPVAPVRPVRASGGAAPQNAQGSPCVHGGKPAVASWSLGLQGGPAKLQLGTTNQEQFGGLLGLDVCEGGGRDHTDLFVDGFHSKAYESGSSAINTDVVTAELDQQHYLGSRGVAVFGLLEEFTNNSLGIAAQKSVGVGVLSPQFANRLFLYDFALDGRYVDEHRDHTSPALHLAGVRIKEQMHTLPGKTVTWNEQGWVLPMLNDTHALQAYISAGPSVALRSWLKLSLSEEENYVGNAPAPNRKNYTSTQLTLSIERSGGSTR